MSYEILLYYTYVHIDQPVETAAAQKALCKELGLTGRLIVAAEGINGTLEGTVENTQAYIDACAKDPLFANVLFKRSPGTGSAFPKLSVKARSEIVSAHLGEQDVFPPQVSGKRLSAEELHDWIHSDKEFYIVDMRNDYEHKVGHFADSLLLGMKNFRDLPDMLPQLEHLKGKTVVTVCTGGVRCEKASGFLVQSGFSDVYQLQDGIVSYMEKYPNQDFKGALYVFDGRVTMGFNLDAPDHEIVGRCEYCGGPSEHYEDCANHDCHRHFICCLDCLKKEGPITYCEEVCSSLRPVLARA
jgi:UPF0176 protein